MVWSFALTWRCVFWVPYTSHRKREVHEGKYEQADAPVEANRCNTKEEQLNPSVQTVGFERGNVDSRQFEVEQGRYEEDHQDDYPDKLLGDEDDLFSLRGGETQSGVQYETPKCGGNRYDSHVQCLWAV